MFKNKKSYLVVGSGKLSKHLIFFFQSQNIRILNWCRSKNTNEELQEMHKACDYTLLCISDSSLINFIAENQLSKEHCVHFSGSLLIPGTLQFHPLMTFSQTLYPIHIYKNIYFIGVNKQPTLKDVFPFLENPYYEIDPDKKPIYHAMCVLSGNFTNILWTKAFTEFEKIGLPKEALMPFMEQVFKNLYTANTLTGPLSRKDTLTLQKNLDSLRGDLFFDVYKSFIHAYDPNLIKEIQI